MLGLVRLGLVRLGSKQELLGQFSSTVEQKLYHWEGRYNNEKIWPK
jgi:hypothetical protein